MIIMPYGWPRPIAAAHRPGRLLAPHRRGSRRKPALRSPHAARRGCALLPNTRVKHKSNTERDLSGNPIHQQIDYEFA
jgi:hypothetical protein